MIVSSTVPPVSGWRNADRVDWLSGRVDRPAGVNWERKASAPGPVKWCWTMWLTSNKLAFDRVQRWDSTMLRSEYCTGMWWPPNGTILPPCFTWRSYNSVLRSCSFALEDACLIEINPCRETGDNEPFLARGDSRLGIRKTPLEA